MDGKFVSKNITRSKNSQQLSNVNSFFTQNSLTFKNPTKVQIAKKILDSQIFLIWIITDKHEYRWKKKKN